MSEQSPTMRSSLGQFLALIALLAMPTSEALSQRASDNPFSGRSITFRTGYTARTCLATGTQCSTNRVPFGTWEQVYISADGQVERFTYSEHTYSFTIGQPDEQGSVYQFEGRDFVYRVAGQIWRFRAQGNRCAITVRSDRAGDDAFRTTINLTRQECELTEGRRPWAHAD